ncbi:hypothetical protein [Silvimonas amylolytica]|uniref:Uncharacterized protein n=1 Tax=Silvimonas amylolytica TaxID=449663 RepID=A0ABQ2PL64_9NEIS|nr:hypothetical protein [Silvimonas amylolytica]GGP26360.1 hypothetical protein GCM10010971_21790 [Silvimonas amylolytica]
MNIKYLAIFVVIIFFPTFSLNAFAGNPQYVPFGRYQIDGPAAIKMEDTGVLYYISENGKVHVMDVVAGKDEERCILPTISEYFSGFSFSSDSEFVFHANRYWLYADIKKCNSGKELKWHEIGAGKVDARETNILDTNKKMSRFVMEALTIKKPGERPVYKLIHGDFSSSKLSIYKPVGGVSDSEGRLSSDAKTATVCAIDSPTFCFEFNLSTNKAYSSNKQMPQLIHQEGAAQTNASDKGGGLVLYFF